LLNRELDPNPNFSHYEGISMSKVRLTTGNDGLAPPNPATGARRTRLGPTSARYVLTCRLFGPAADQDRRTGELRDHGGTTDALCAAASRRWPVYCTESSGAGADPSSQVGTWSGSLVLELLAVVPFLAAIPALFHELAHSTLLHSHHQAQIDIALGASELCQW